MAAAQIVEQVPAGVPDKGLRTGALGLVQSTVMGIASTAPAYSLAATLGYLILVAGVHSPGVLLLAFVPMYCVAVGYEQLNRWDPDCGTTFTWAARVFGPRTGWMGGWGVIAADIVVMANLGDVAGKYGFDLFGAHGLANSTAWRTLAGCAWIALMTLVCYLGIEVSARLQFALLAIEIVTLLAFAVVALIRTYTGDAPEGHLHPSASWLLPTHVGGFAGLSIGLLLATFIYWGWDTSVSVNEETANARETPGRAAVLSTVLLLVTYLVVAIATQAFAGVGDKGIGLGNPDNADDVLSVLGGAVLGSALAKVLVIMVLTSAAASTLTSILPTARTTLAMASYRALPKSFARVNARTQAPSVSTVVMGVVSIAFYVGLAALGADLYNDAIGSIGLMIAFYYGMTALTCVWQFRRELTTSVHAFLVKGLIPFVGGVTLAALFVYGIYKYGQKPSDTAVVGSYTTLGGIGAATVIGVGALLLGVVLMVVWNVVSPSFFRGDSFAPDDASEVLVAGPVPPNEPEQVTSG